VRPRGGGITGKEPVLIYKPEYESNSRISLSN